MSGLTMLNVAEMAATPPPPVPWIVEPLLARSHVTMLAGREGTGKSMLALGLAAALGNGQTVGPMDPAAPGGVLFVDAENGVGEVHRRIHALSAVPSSLAYASAEGFDMRAPERWRDLTLMVGEHKPDVVVLDSLRSLAPSFDENDSGAAESLLANFRRLARAHSCAVLVLAHAGKGESGREYRGSSALGAAIEIGFTLSREPTDPEKRTRRRLSCWKMRPAAEPETMWLSLDAAEGRLAIGEAEAYAPTPGDAGSATDHLAQQMGATVAERGEISRADLFAAVGRTSRDGTAARALDAARKAGLVAKAGHGTYGPPSSQVAGEVSADVAKYPASHSPNGDGWLDTFEEPVA